jgi:hypothetical protein
MFRKLINKLKSAFSQPSSEELKRRMKEQQNFKREERKQDKLKKEMELEEEKEQYFFISIV